MDKHLFVLGTAQIGGTYGIANKTGRPGEDEVDLLIGSATKSGITRFDTAAAYGNSEQRLGEAFARLGLNQTVSIATKGSISGVPSDGLADIVKTSLHNLQVERLESWLLHREEEIDGWSSSFRRQARQLTEDGLIASFGASVYRLGPAIKALRAEFFDTIQCPASPFDRRFLRSEELRDLAQRGCRINFRSVFLQGLCLMNPEDVPGGIHQGRESVALLRDFCLRHGLEQDYFCLHYVLHRSANFAAGVILGCETSGQVLRNVQIAERKGPPQEVFEEWDHLFPEDLEPLIFPFAWDLAKK